MIEKPPATDLGQLPKSIGNFVGVIMQGTVKVSHVRNPETVGQYDTLPQGARDLCLYPPDLTDEEVKDLEITRAKAVERIFNQTEIFKNDKQRAEGFPSISDGNPYRLKQQLETIRLGILTGEIDSAINPRSFWEQDDKRIKTAITHRLRGLKGLSEDETLVAKIEATTYLKHLGLDPSGWLPEDLLREIDGAVIEEDTPQATSV